MSEIGSSIGYTGEDFAFSGYDRFSSGSTLSAGIGKVATDTSYRVAIYMKYVDKKYSNHPEVCNSHTGICSTLKNVCSSYDQWSNAGITNDDGEEIAAVGGNIWKDQNKSNTVWQTDAQVAIQEYLRLGGATPYKIAFGFVDLCLTSDHGVTYGFGADIGGVGIQTETDHSQSVQQCVEANASDGFSNENRTDVVDGDYDNFYYFWGRSLTFPLGFQSVKREPETFYDY